MFTLLLCFWAAQHYRSRNCDTRRWYRNSPKYSTPFCLEDNWYTSRNITSALVQKKNWLWNKASITQYFEDSFLGNCDSMLGNRFGIWWHINCGAYRDRRLHPWHSSFFGAVYFFYGIGASFSWTTSNIVKWSVKSRQHVVQLEKVIPARDNVRLTSLAGAWLIDCISWTKSYTASWIFTLGQ